MRLLHKLVEFGVAVPDLVNNYVLYVRSILEQSCQVWNSALTLENSQNVERVQKTSLKIILKSDYQTYKNALDVTGLTTLAERRLKLCLNFAKKCFKHQEMKQMSPLNPSNEASNTRFREKYKVDSSR